MGYVRLKQLIEQNAWREAGRELGQYMNGEWDDELAVLAATVFSALGDWEGAYTCIAQGLQYNYRNYELYLLLGNYYERKNCNQAWLCYENALYYCSDEDDRRIIQQHKERVQQDDRWCVHKVSIVILTYNLKDMNMQCIGSIRDTCDPSSYELVVVDNASTDGTLEWLREQKDMTLVSNQENKGFPAGCNQGIKAAEPENDILLLNNDTIVLPNSIFWLRMGLYEEERIGATGSMSNSVINRQRIEAKLAGVEEYITYGTAMNIPMENALEKKTWLVGFAMLLKRKALDEVGLLDERFSPGQNEDVDLCIRLNLAGWQMRLCHNSFIVHYGHGNGRNSDIWKQTFSVTSEKFREKWGFDMSYYTYSRKELIAMISEPKESRIRVLEHLHDPERILQKLLSYLKADGSILCSVPNILNRHVISDLLRGKLEYQDAGILDRTHLRFFTMDSIVRVFERCGMEVTQMMATYDTEELDAEAEELMNALYQIPHIADRQLFQVYQYVFRAKREREAE